ncbi:MAG: adenosylcobinamide-GDP ribazoletransferase [Brachymonas sp.]|nr:adenosylcobinamide-GDP ribazoletransferase [Brachymonas sp.]
MQHSLRSLLLALQFFTRIPLPSPVEKWVGFAPERMREAMGYMPAIGWLVGMVASLVYAGVLELWGTPLMLRASPTLLALLAALLSTAATIWLTGGMHEDGLADVADALGGYASSERALQIMKDSRVGNYAVLTLGMALVLKMGLLAALALLQTRTLFCVLVTAHVVSRFFPLLLVNWLPHVALEGQSKTRQVAGVIGGIRLWSAALWCLPLAAVYWLPRGGALLLLLVGSCTVIAGLVAMLMGWWFHRRLKGFTGDCLGATQQACELACYATALTVMLQVIAV